MVVQKSKPLALSNNDVKYFVCRVNFLRSTCYTTSVIFVLYLLGFSFFNILCAVVGIM